MPDRRITEGLLRMGPHGGAHWVALRAGVSVLVPLVVLLAMGRQEWSAYAAFGALTSIYGRNHSHIDRRRMQSVVGTILTLGVGLGVAVGASGSRRWLAVPTAAAIAVAASLISDLQGWHPPGPLFVVFAFGAVASGPSRLSAVPLALAVAGATAVFAVLVGSAGSLSRRRRGTAEPDTRTVRAGGLPEGARRRAGRVACALLLAGGLATSTGIGHPYWAMVSAVVPLAAREWHSQVARGLQRLGGTGVGLLVAAGLLALHLGGLGLLLVVAALQVGAELLVGRNYALALVCITPLALLMGEVVVRIPAAELLRDRGLETLIGVAVGLVVGWATRARTPPTPAVAADVR